MKHEYKLLIACILAGAIFGALAGFGAATLMPKSQDQLISDFYATEMAASVSPSDFVSELKNGNAEGIAIDLRSSGEYAQGHLVGALNIPSVEMNSQQLIAAFQKLPKDKPAILYCYSSYCMLSKSVGKTLADNGIYAKDFSAGWYEIKRDFSDYIVNGTQPGELQISQGDSGQICTTSGGEFHC
ncbi:MAG: rhodanese-like domain-containing protein [Candidatus Micrarchaeota archaeon]